jgi:hypothetical protein
VKGREGDETPETEKHETPDIEQETRTSRSKATTRKWRKVWPKNPDYSDLMQYSCMHEGIK